MKKGIALLLVIISAVVYYGSNSSLITERFTDYRSTTSAFNVAHRGLGDLYNMCFLSDFNSPVSYHLKEVKSEKKRVRLFLFCDSYLISHVRKEHFYGVDSLVKIKWWDHSSYQTIQRLDSNYRNILIAELSERFVRGACSDFTIMTEPLVIDPDLRLPAIYNNPDAEKPWSGIFLSGFCINKNINSNLELNLFGYKFFNPVKELKGDLNYRLFNRINKDVFLDEKNNFLFYKPTVSGEQSMNSFYPIDSSEYNKIIETLTLTKSHYKKAGFKEVYFSFVPNPVSIVNPELGKYNQLMPSISATDTSLFRTIDVFHPFKKNPKKYYANNDTHWNSNGLQKWLEVTNAQLQSFIEDGR